MVKAWPIRTRYRALNDFGSPLGRVRNYKCDLGHEWASNYRHTEKFCRACVEAVAYAIERMAAALGGRPRVGKYPHLPSDGPRCDCAKKGIWA